MEASCSSAAAVELQPVELSSLLLINNKRFVSRTSVGVKYASGGLFYCVYYNRSLLLLVDVVSSHPCALSISISISLWLLVVPCCCSLTVSYGCVG